MFSLRKKRRDFQNLYDFLPLPFKVSWDKLFGNLEFDSVSRLSLSKAWFSWEILCQVSVFRARTKLPATSYYLECSDRSDRFRRCCNAVEVSYCHDSHRKNRFPYKISLKRYLPNDLYHLNYHVEELYLKLILCLYQFYCYLQLLQFLAIVSESWWNLKSFVPTWMVKWSRLHFSGGLMYVIIPSVDDPLKIAVTIWSFLRSCLFLLCLKFTFFLSWDTCIIWFIAFVWKTLSIIFHWHDIVSNKAVYGVIR